MNFLLLFFFLAKVNKASLFWRAIKFTSKTPLNIYSYYHLFSLLSPFPLPLAFILTNPSTRLWFLNSESLSLFLHGSRSFPLSYFPFILCFATAADFNDTGYFWGEGEVNFWMKPKIKQSSKQCGYCTPEFHWFCLFCLHMSLLYFTQCLYSEWSLDIWEKPPTRTWETKTNWNRKLGENRNDAGSRIKLSCYRETQPEDIKYVK